VPLDLVVHVGDDAVEVAAGEGLVGTAGGLDVGHPRRSIE
jgi:hypothetical protein